MFKNWPVNSVVKVPDHSNLTGYIVEQLDNRLYEICLYHGPSIITSDESFVVLSVPMETKDYITMDKLIDGGTYRIQARNANFGIWIGKEGCFIIRRTKFQDTFLFIEYHWDMPAFATVKPLELIEVSPFKIEALLMQKEVKLEDEEKIISHTYTYGQIILQYLKSFEEKK